MLSDDLFLYFQLSSANSRYSRETNAITRTLKASNDGNERLVEA